jgi:hypothetical protein
MFRSPQAAAILAISRATSPFVDALPEADAVPNGSIAPVSNVPHGVFSRPGRM